MTITQMLQEIISLGYAGVNIWEGTQKNRWCGCLVNNDIHMTPLHETNLWNYVAIVEEVFELLLESAKTRKKISR